MYPITGDQQHDRALYIIAVLYCRLGDYRDPALGMYVSYMANTKHLAWWLIPDEAGCKGRDYSNVQAPDICGVCFHCFGETIGGRVRVGCVACRRHYPSILDGYTVNELCKILKIDSFALEILFANVIKELHGSTSAPSTQAA